jgi:L-fucose isomerase-like protein
MTIRAGFVGFGEVNSPRELIERKCSDAAQALCGLGITLVTTAPVADDPAGEQSRRAADELAREPFDALVVCIAGWIPSYAVIAVIDRFRHLPMVLWGLKGQMHGERLVTTADQAGTTALRQTLADMGLRFTYVWDSIDSDSHAPQVAEVLRAASAASSLRGARIGMMGCRDMNLYGTMYDPASLRGTIGCEVEHFEMLEITQRIAGLKAADVAAVADRVRSQWTFVKEPKAATLETGARWYLALRDKARERGYQAVSLVDVDGMKKLVGFPPSMVFMLLADDPGVCVIPENDSLGAATQLIARALTGQCAAYFEFYEFMKDRVLMGVPDFVPAEIVNGPVTVDPTAFGSFSEGLLNVSKVKTGRVTLSRLVRAGGQYALHVATGEAITARPWEEAGWRPPAPQLPGLEIILDCPVEEFGQKVLSQHYSLTYGDNKELFRRFCSLSSIQEW